MFLIHWLNAPQEVSLSPSSRPSFPQIFISLIVICPTFPHMNGDTVFSSPILYAQPLLEALFTRYCVLAQKYIVVKYACPMPQICMQTGLLDYDKLEENALVFRPKLIISGGSAYPRDWDYKRLREIADKCGSYLMTDMAHIRSATVTSRKSWMPL